MRPLPSVPMMQSAQARHRNYGCFRRRLWLDRSAGRRIFAEAIVNSIFVVVVHIIADQPTEMWFVQRDDVVEDFPPANFAPIFPPFHSAKAPVRSFV